MSKIFRKNNGPAVDVKRNTFDLSFGSHVTGKLGDLIPVYCQEVIPGDSFEIDPKFGLRFNPTVFPIQTKMHGVMHFFYVRNRNLYKDWQEYITRTNDDAVMPYLSITESNAKDIIGTGSLGDYLGVPTTLTGEYAQKLGIALDTCTLSETPPVLPSIQSGSSFRNMSVSPTFNSTALSTVNRKASSYVWIPANVFSGAVGDLDANPNLVYKNWDSYPTINHAFDGSVSYHRLYGYMGRTVLAHPITTSNVDVSTPMNLGSSNLNLDKGAYLFFVAGADKEAGIDKTRALACISVGAVYDATKGTVTLRMSNNAATVNAVNAINDAIQYRNVYVGLIWDTDVNTTDWLSLPSVLPTSSSYKNPGDYLTFDAEGIQVYDATDPNTVVYNPFVLHAGQTTPKIKLNALPFRAYESIYNYFYRDETVDPFRINGKEAYNDFITTHNGGADFTPYRLFQKNWERDYYTSCQVSPQQGTAPLVGISANGTFTFDDGTNQYTASMTIGDDGETITGISTYSPDMPKGSLRQLMDVVTNGLSINDLRAVNSFQKWLETNIRRGYKYVDQIYSHFGVNPAFKANDCPEFIGGIHSVGDVNQVTNMSADGLGQYAGQLTMFGGSDNKIHQYCDEHGYIIGIMCVFPEPVYSQMLPKHFLKTETPLDYFFPEFGHIGMQPITYNEVTPLEVAASDASEGTDTINDVFGYQRAWADYLSNNDSVHGDFRTSLSEYVVNRVFNSKPELGHDFIAIDDNDINDVFVTTDDSDKMLGELRFDVKAKRPIPEYGIPRIE